MKQLAELEWLGSERLKRRERSESLAPTLGYAAKVLVALRVGGRPRHIYCYTASGWPAPGQVVPGGDLADSRPWIFSTALNPGESGRQAGCESDRFYHPTKYTSGLTNLRIE